MCINQSNGKNNIVLYADIGNSTIDFLLANGNSFSVEKVRTRSKDDIFDYIGKMEDIHEAYISSVNSSGLQSLKEALAHKFPHCRIFFIDQKAMKEYASSHGIKVDNIDILGSDLFCDIVSEDNETGMIVVDLGTASKILYLDKNFCFKGCQIFPGLSSFSEILHAKTDLLKDSPIIINPPLVSLKTEECISSGVINGVSSLISGMVQAIKKEYDNKDAKVILTGGNSYLIKDTLKTWMKDDFIYDVYHTLKGLVRISGHDITFLKGE